MMTTCPLSNESTQLRELTSTLNSLHTFGFISASSVTPSYWMVDLWLVFLNKIQCDQKYTRTK